MSSPACSNQGEGKLEMLSRRLSEVLCIFSGKKGGFL
jgi:hypothetical protein